MSRDERVSCYFTLRVNFKMVNFWLFYLFFSLLYVVSVGTSQRIRYTKRSAGAHWGYSAKNGPSTWRGICLTGKKQSPINIELGTTIVKDFPPFSFSEDYLSKQKFYVKNNGHTVQVAIEDDSAQPVISGGGLENKFIFEQLHFHWESEHEFDGKRADLEMHVVHYNSKYKNFAEAVTKADGIAVLAVIFNGKKLGNPLKYFAVKCTVFSQEKNETDHLIGDFFRYIVEKLEPEEPHSFTPSPNNLFPELFSEGNENKEFASFSLRDLLPKYLYRFFRYQGSLTTPECNEVVQWTVFINRLPVPSKALKVFKTLKDNDGNTLLKTFKPPQNLNGREVFIQINNYENMPKYNCESLTGAGSSSNSLMILYPSLVACSHFLK